MSPDGAPNLKWRVAAILAAGLIVAVGGVMLVPHVQRLGRLRATLKWHQQAMLRVERRAELQRRFTEEVNGLSPDGMLSDQARDRLRQLRQEMETASR